ncbi:MAG: diacylglycerol kinase family protein [Solirubrobacteraceae bacterium]
MVLVVLEGRVLGDVSILAGLVLSVGAASRVFAVHTKLPVASPPNRPVLFYNAKSGGGKAERFQVAREARARGVEPVELHLGDDLGTLVRDAIGNGADAVGVAGGDGTQAIVAAIAAERGLPYVCVPAGRVTISRLISVSTAMTWSEPSMRSRRVASAWLILPRSTAACS